LTRAPTGGPGGLDQLRELLESRLPPGPADVTALRRYLVAVVRVLDRDLWREAAGGRPFSVTAIERTLAVRSSDADAGDATRITRFDTAALGASCERLVVLGGAGAGKSWLARRYAIRAAEAALERLTSKRQVQALPSSSRRSRLAATARIASPGSCSPSAARSCSGWSAAASHAGTEPKRRRDACTSGGAVAAMPSLPLVSAGGA
jgi:hypothetical protein